MTRYTIGQVAERTGFSTSALRYYEQHELIEPVERTAAGYRLYDEVSLARLTFIDRAKQLGCSLEEITELAALWANDECGPVQARLHDLVTAKIADAQRRSAELVRFTAQLQTAASRLGTEPVDGPCGDACACLGHSRPSEPTTVGLGERADPAIACTLPGDQMPDRIAEWQTVLAHVTRREALGDAGLRLGLDADTPLNEVVRLATTEQGCCNFFAFAITVDERGAGLEVRAPAAAADLVIAVFGAVA